MSPPGAERAADPALVRAAVAQVAEGGEVQERETHISHLFLTSDRAFKLKKPVTPDFLDYGTAAQRKAMCLDEVRLNSRLAPSVYLGVRALVGGADGLEFAVADASDAVDYRGRDRMARSGLPRRRRRLWRRCAGVVLCRAPGAGAREDPTRPRRPASARQRARGEGAGESRELHDARRALRMARARAPGVIVDATFRLRDDRVAFAEAFGSVAPIVFVECLAPPDVVAERAQGPGSAIRPGSRTPPSRSPSARAALGALGRGRAGIARRGVDRSRARTGDRRPDRWARPSLSADVSPPGRGPCGASAPLTEPGSSCSAAGRAGMP